MQVIQDEIILAFNQGDEQAFNVIFKFFFQEIFYFTEKVTGNTEEAKDITSATFTSLFRLRMNFDTHTNIKAFLYITARNTCFNYLKSEKRRRNSLKNIAYRQQQIQTFELDRFLQFSIIEGMSLKEVYAAVDKLPLECGRIFKLLFFEGLKPNEIAAQLSITPETVRSQKRRAIELLRIKFSDNQLAVALLFIHTLAYCESINK
jgi:RNA polymerase sigma-70 factor (ECF subfamily)